MKKTALILAAVLVSSLTFAQTDLSGSWTLNASKSQLGERTFAPKELVLVQKDNNLSIESHTAFQEQEMTTTDKLTLDGKECTNAGFMDTQKKSIATWSDDKTTLKVVSKIAFQDQTIATTESYKLNAGTLVVESSMNAPFGETKETRIYDKK
jgi:hypothetical protein